MSLFKEIKKKVYQEENKENLSRLMGYQVLSRFQKRLDSLMICTHLKEWLKSSGYDFVHSNESFLIKLCECLSFSETQYMPVINDINATHLSLARMPQPYIFVNTNFKRQGETIISLAFMEGHRHIMIPKELVYYSDDEGVSRVSKMVKSHYDGLKNGALLLWGKIENYVYHVNKKTFLFNTEGKIISEEEEGNPSHPRAVLLIGSRMLPLSIIDKR